MPSKSKAQYRLMQAVRHSAKFAKKVGIPQNVGNDYAAADAGEDYAALPDKVPAVPARTAKRPAGKSGGKGRGKMSSAAVKVKAGAVRKPGGGKPGGGKPGKPKGK